MGYSQDFSSNRQVKKVVKALAKAYDLDKVQIKSVSKIQKEYHVYLSEIESLKIKNSKIFYEKRKAIREHAEAQMVKVMNSDQREQLNRFVEDRTKKVDELVRGATKQEIGSDALYLRLAALY